MDSFDTETFVKLVRARSALWDVRTEEYANKVKRKECWLEIFRIMIEDFDELHDDMKVKVSKYFCLDQCVEYRVCTVREVGFEFCCKAALIHRYGESTLEVLRAEIQRKWKSLRNCFTRELMKQKSENSGAGASNRKKYMYFDILTFLAPALLDKTTHYLTVVDEDKTITVKEEDGHREAPIEKDTSIEKEKQILPTLKRRKIESDDVLHDLSKALEDINRILKELFKCRTQHESVLGDEDKLFLLSLHRDLKSIPPEKRLMAKVELMQILHKYNNF